MLWIAGIFVGSTVTDPLSFLPRNARADMIRPLSHMIEYFVLFLGLYVAVLLAVIVATVAAVKNLSTPAQLAAFSGAMGLSLGGAIELLRRCWQQWSDGTLLMILLEGASVSDAEAKKVIKELLKRRYGKS